MRKGTSKVEKVDEIEQNVERNAQDDFWYRKWIQLAL